ncbi:carboxypeptidase-like regulatory domain-containing protein [uncultured Sunxiuqinia sp.]|uniref:carboxypeptidase-like regulatory domain-containing protein n=1 Tax=uncultured Sunxiuqinia sp. TaxID=1573825 RepID=UPI002AA6F68D|nr:carboxypeptidase-like regulatory domain-containing protein [uncultured Sunxiuqinia sp.]
MKALLFTVLFTVLISFSFAAEKQTKEESKTEVTTLSLSGQVMDKVSHEALVGVKVCLEGTDKVAYTDFDGNYQFNGVAAGQYNLTASYISYEESKMENIQLSLKKSELNISLEVVD